VPTIAVSPAPTFRPPKYHGAQRRRCRVRSEPEALRSLRLARALAGVINILDPDVIVLGGGLSNIDRLYENVPRLWDAHVFRPCCNAAAEAPPRRFLRRARRRMAMELIAPSHRQRHLFRPRRSCCPGKVAAAPSPRTRWPARRGSAATVWQVTNTLTHAPTVAPEKAVHLFPLEHYDALARAFPEARHLHPGGLGENLSTRGMTEEPGLHWRRVHALGSGAPADRPAAHALLEDRRALRRRGHGRARRRTWHRRLVFSRADRRANAVRAMSWSMSNELARRGQPGTLQPDSLREARPSLQVLDRLASAPGLAPDWVRKIRGRIEWLQNNKDAV
jgi:hypothetical protein